MSEVMYLGLMERLIDEGEKREGRNGSVRSMFGEQVRYDLRKGFPLLTTKRVFWKGVAAELLWMLSGDTNAQTLEDQGVNIWREWGNPETRELGPVYSHQWVNYGGTPKAIPQKVPNMREGVPRTYLGVGNGSGSSSTPIGKIVGKTWEGMMARCYSRKCNTYPLYGGRGVSVCDEWLEFSKFSEDVQKIPGWGKKVENGPVRIVLDKDIRGDGFTYSPETCTWITDQENACAISNMEYTVNDGEKDHTFTNASEFCLKMGIEPKNFSDLWTGNKSAKVRSGYRLVRYRDMSVGVNQIANVIESLKSDPFGRRHIVNAWNPSQLHMMALPPCHFAFQFFVSSDGYLDCQLYQRSCDYFLGAPFNIASYSLLTHLMARECGYKPRYFIHTMGDVHLYENHIEAAELQLTRRPEKFPELVIHGDKGIFDITLDDLEIVGYDPYPAIKAEVSA